MGKNAHPPRGGGSSKKAPPNKNEDDGPNIIFTNAKDDPKKKGTASASQTDKGKGKSKTQDQPPEDGPKKPTTRELIAGTSWTGKLPMNLLAEHCQRQKWEKPEYTMNRVEGGFSSMVILRSKNQKTQELTTLDPFKLPPTHKHLAVQPSAAEARHFAAAYALFRVSSMKNIHMTMPPAYRDLWKGDFQDLKKADEVEGKGWSYAADPFQVQKERADAKIQKEKKFEQRQKEEEKRENQPGGAGVSKDQMRGWNTAPKVEMGKKLRSKVENLVKRYGVWNPNDVRIPKQVRDSLSDQIEKLGFRRSHVKEAVEICKDKEEVLEWLLIHVPEDDLPKWCLPEGYVAGLTIASGDLKREAKIKRLAGAGYSTEDCGQMLDATRGDERKASQILQDALMIGQGAQTLTARINNLQVNDNDEESETNWKEEQSVLSSIFEERFENANENTCKIRLEMQSGSIVIRFTRPISNYPENPPLLSFDGTELPSYIRLSVIRQCLLQAPESFLGEQMIFNMVDWMENSIGEVIKDPGRLSDIWNAGNAQSMDKQALSTNSNATKPKQRQKPSALKHDEATNESLWVGWENRHNTAAQQNMVQSRQKLPAWNLKEAIIRAVDNKNVVIISGETGSGKSTQAVQFILDNLIQKKRGASTRIVCTQPRRISALGLADRVAEERCSKVGDEVGYVIRGESKQSSNTRITFVTTGVLLRRLQTSGGSTKDVVASLADISHVVVDEVHERNLDTDFLLALLRDVLQHRKDLKVILMSATLDADTFARYFGGDDVVAKIHIEGRTFPVEDYYVDDVVRMTNYANTSFVNDDEDRGFQSQSVSKTLQTLGMGINYELIAALVQRIDKDLGDEQGGILIFLPGTMEISRTLDALKSATSLYALPLHASLLPSEQKRVFPPAPHGKRKVIASTNVAETSITIPDIVAVIDSGRVKETHYDPQGGMTRLEEVWASRAACKQRQGRAGRVQAGKSYKLFTRSAESKMAERPDPEIRRVPLEQLCLSVKAMGIDDVSDFLANTLTPPESIAVESAIELLRRVGALDGEVLTALGRHMAMIPADLRCAKLMVYGALFGCLEPSVTIASILTLKSPFVSPQDKREEAKKSRESFSQHQGDIIADLHAYDEWIAMRSNRLQSEVRRWCNDNFLSFQTLSDIASTRSQYLSSLKEIGFLSATYNGGTSSSSVASDFNRNAASVALLHSLLLSALHPNTLRILYPPQKYTATISGTLAVDPESKSIKFFDSNNTRVFTHPSSSLFSAQSFSSGPGNPNAAFMSYFNRVQTSKDFVREISPCGGYGMLLFGGKVELDTIGRGLVVDGWVRMRGWARIGVLVNRLRAILDAVLERWIEEPPSHDSSGQSNMEERVVSLVRQLVELDGMDQ